MAIVDSEQTELVGASMAAPQKSVPLQNCNFFFIHPAPWMREEMFPALIRAEIPVYGIKHFNILPLVSRKFPESVYFLNADYNNAGETLEWPQIISQIAGILNETRSTIIFISRGLTTARRDALRQLGISINFIELNQASKLLSKQMYSLVQAFSQKSRRRTIRVTCTEKNKAIYNVQVENQQIRGVVSDISSAGMAAILPEPYPISIQDGRDLIGLQINLKGSLILVNAQVVAVRKRQGHQVLICLFRWGPDKRAKERIHAFIGACLQESLDQLGH